MKIPVPVSTVPAMKAYLLSQLVMYATATTDHSILVCLGEPGPYQPDDIVSVGDCHSRQLVEWQMIGNGGNGWLHEEYHVNVTVSVFRGGSDPVDAYTRAWQLASIVESVVRQDPSFGGLLIECHPSSSRDTQRWEDSHKGQIVTVEINIAASAAL